MEKKELAKKIPGWRTMDSSQRHNAKMGKIFDHYRGHVESLKTSNPAEHKHMTEHLMSKRYPGCKYGYCNK